MKLDFQDKSFKVDNQMEVNSTNANQRDSEEAYNNKNDRKCQHVPTPTNKSIYSFNKAQKHNNNQSSKGSNNNNSSEASSIVGVRSRALKVRE